MIGRRDFTVAGLTAVTLGALQNPALAQRPITLAAKGEEAHGEMLDACAKACSDCQRECERCATHCGRQLEAGKKDHIKTLATCLDCASFCAAAASIVARSGPFAAIICKACVDACAMCAKECEKFRDDKHMQACAEECRKCEKACTETAAHGAHNQGQK